MLQIEYLADHPALAPTLARWHYDEWRDLIPDWSYEAALEALGTHRNRAAIPTTFVAFRNDTLIGSASLLVEDVPEWGHLTPWVASVYVVPSERGRKVGSRLVRHAVSVAGRLGAKEVYLLTPGQGEFDAKTSVLNGWNQAHDIPNLFVTDGACMTSSANQNPSITYMALTARAVAHAVDLINRGEL